MASASADAPLDMAADEAVAPQVFAATIAAEPEQAAAPPLLPRLWRWGMIVGEFGAVQVAVQAAGALAGFIIVRSLAKPEYALYAVANAGIAMFNMLADSGIGAALRSVGGEVHGDRTRFSQLVATVCQLRRLFALFAVVISFPVTAWMLRSNGATIVETALLCVIVFTATLPLLTGSILRDSSLMLGKYRKVQRVDFTTAAVRLTLIVAMFARLSASAATAITALANWIQWLAYKRRAWEDVDLTERPDDSFRRRVLATTYRVIPNTLFFCFQGQFTYVLLTLLGTTTDLADVAALGRISALIAIFGVAFNNVLAPRFARCQVASRLPRLYVGLVIAMATVLMPILIFTWSFPQVVLWILGDAYGRLEYELSLAVLAACLFQINGVMISLNSSRNWLRWYGYFNIASVLCAQLVGILLIDLSTVSGVLWFSIISAVAPMPVFLADTVTGLRQRR